MKAVAVRCMFVALALASATMVAGAAEWEALVGTTGRVEVSYMGKPVASVSPGLFRTGWRHSGPGTGTIEDGAVKSRIRAGRDAVVDVVLRAEATPDGVRLDYTLTPQADVAVNSRHVSISIPVGLVAGLPYSLGDEQGTIPAEFGNVGLTSDTVQSARISLANGQALQIEFADPTPVLLQDGRQWGPSFEVRIGPQTGGGYDWKAGEELHVALELKVPGGMTVEHDTPVIIEAGEDWVPLQVELDVEAGSALDFSGFGQIDAPAGKHGWIVTTPEGRFAYEDSPGTPRRFYGVNFCFSAHYITHEESDRLAERLTRLGYNTVRFHHYEGELVDRSGGTSTTLKPEKLDQLDYLFAALKKRGIYVTTDLLVSRPVFKSEIYDGAENNASMNDIKMAVLVNERAFENWKEFSRNLLTHVNPYTGLSYAADPALAWLCMINEGNAGNYIGGLGGEVAEDWTRAWNEFLAAKYGDAAALQAAWGVDPEGDPAAGTVPLHRNTNDDSVRGRDLVVFLAATERDAFARMKSFLRDEIGTKALLTNQNSWTDRVQNQAARAEYDYVDGHFYVDHPQFLERSWRLPSRSANTSPVAGGAGGGRHLSFLRMMDKPFTVSEYNYSGPGRFRGVGGILTGAMAAVQDWDIIWRFAYSHSRRNLFAPSPAGYFDLVTDPLNQAADRAAVCLFLRGDMQPARHSAAISMSSRELVESAREVHDVAPPWHWLALVTRVGTVLTDGGAPDGIDTVLPLGWDPEAAEDPYAGATGEGLLTQMRERGWLDGNLTDPGRNLYHSETGELLVDAPRDVMVLNTPMTSGCYAPEGETVDCGAVTVTVDRTDATVWVSSVDDQPIATSRRLVITHLTDLQNTGARFGERARQTLQAWGEMPHLVLTGEAKVSIDLQNAADAKVWALATSGRRVASVEAEVQDGRLIVPLSVAGPEGARMVYEVAFE